MRDQHAGEVLPAAHALEGRLLFSRCRYAPHGAPLPRLSNRLVTPDHSAEHRIHHVATKPCRRCLTTDIRRVA